MRCWWPQLEEKVRARESHTENGRYWMIDFPMTIKPQHNGLVHWLSLYNIMYGVYLKRQIQTCGMMSGKVLKRWNTNVDCLSLCSDNEQSYQLVPSICVNSFTWIRAAPLLPGDKRQHIKTVLTWEERTLQCKTCEQAICWKTVVPSSVSYLCKTKSVQPTYCHLVVFKSRIVSMRLVYCSNARHFESDSRSESPWNSL